MNEDSAFNSFVRGRLEDGLGEPPRLEAILRSAAVSRGGAIGRLRVWRPLLAASVAAVCAFAVLWLRPSLSPEATVADVIDILSVSDGLALATERASVAERLLSWQDAPYVQAVEDLSSCD